MKNLTVGLHIGAGSARGQVDGIIAAEQAGIECAWLTSGGPAPDPVAIFAAASEHTSRIRFGTSIMPTFLRHPVAFAQGAVALDALAPGRFRLGIGPSHKPSIEGMLGIPFEHPLGRLREYITILRTLFETGRADFEGKFVTARVELPKPIDVQVLASALRPNGFRLCGELAEGAISWDCPLPYLREVAVPAIAEGAAKAGRTPPPLIAHVPVVVSTDREAVRRGAQRQLGFYPRVPYYSQMLQDAGFPEAREGELSDRMADALVVQGTADEVKARLRELPSFGAGELLAMPVLLEDDREARDRTIAVLGEVAQE